MKQILTGSAVIVIFISMLLSPREVFDGAAEGLLLWFQVIVPTLFPFMLVSNLLIESGGTDLIARVTGKGFTHLFGTSSGGSYAVIAGFLCGYPMGAKVTADLLRKEKITLQEGQYLLSFCNNTSPVFIMNYIVWKTFGQQDLLVPTLLILLGVPVVLSFLFRRFYLESGADFQNISGVEKNKNGNTESGMFDHCMMDAFESIVKVGGYIIFFSIFIALMKRTAEEIPVLLSTAPLLEVTNGILLIQSSVENPVISYPLVIGLTSFGGLCAVAQTDCMLQGTQLSILPYIIQKLTAAAAASLIAFLYIKLKLCGL